MLVLVVPLASTDGAASPLALLSRAELEVLGMVLEGSPNRDIAARRGTSVRTAANQVSALVRKLGASSRHGLVVAIERLLERPSGPRR